MTVKTIKIIPVALVLALLAIILQPYSVFANGGTIVMAQDQGPFNVIITRSPSPPTPGTSLHLSILVTKAGSPQKVTDATVIITPGMPGMAMPGTEPVRAFRGGTENTYDIDFPVPMEGAWEYNIQVVSPQYGQTNFVLKDKVEKPEVPWLLIAGILVGMPLMAGLTWYLLFRRSSADDDEDEDEESTPRKPKARKQTN